MKLIPYVGREVEEKQLTHRIAVLPCGNGVRIAVVDEDGRITRKLLYISDRGVQFYSGIPEIMGFRLTHPSRLAID